MPHSAYLDKARGILDHLGATQGEQVEAAAVRIADALAAGGTVSCSEIGHGIQGDFISRAGGLVAVQPFTFRIDVQHPLAACRQRETEDGEADLERVRTAVRVSNLRPGDVMLVSSVSGRNRRPIELALACRDLGVGVIAFTSAAYTAHVQSLHPSGKRLYEVADVVVDVGAPYGDAAVEVPGYEHKLIPVSGLGMLVAGWMVWERVLILMAERGTSLSVLISHNSDGGPAHNEASRAQYDQRGY